MKAGFIAIAATCILIALPSCGGGDKGGVDASGWPQFSGEADGKDSPKKVMEDQITYLEAMTTVLEKVADGDDASQAADKMGELGRAGDTLYARRDKLFKKLSSADLQELVKEHQNGLTNATMKMTLAIKKLQESGNATDELINAVMNMKNN